MSKNMIVKVHSTKPEIEICYSYGVPVAAFVPGFGYIKTDKKYSVTSSKHANLMTRHDVTVVEHNTFLSLIS